MSPRIPRLTHRIWWGSPLPDEFAAYGRQLVTLHPSWNHLLWTDPDDLPLLVNQHLFEFAERIYPDDALRFRADVARYELLWHFGGIYLDTDVEPLAPLDGLLHHEVVMAYEPDSHTLDGRPALGMAVIGARRRHPFIARCINALHDSVVAHRHERLAVATGPGLVTRLYEADPSGVTVLPADTFYPQSIGERRAHQRRGGDGTVALPQTTLAWHKWHHATGVPTP